MAQTGYTPILIYASGTASNVPLAANLTSSASGAELALNYADGKLYFKNSSGVVTLLASSATVAPVTTFSAGTTGFTPSTATSGAVTLAGTLATTNGGTGLTSFTANGVVYASSSSALTTVSALTFDGNTLGVATTAGNMALFNSTAANGGYLTIQRSGVSKGYIGSAAQLSGGSNDDFTVRAEANLVFSLIASEQMRLTSTGLGIGTSSPLNKLVISNSGAVGIEAVPADPNGAAWYYYNRATSSWATTVSYANQHIWNRSGTTEAMRLDSSGNLGLGVTPSAWNSTYKVLQVGSSAALWSIGSGAGGSYLTNNVLFDGSFGRKYIVTGNATEYTQLAGTHAWFTAPSGTAGNAISFTQAMTLDASGRLGIGETSPSQKLTVGATADASNFVRVQSSTAIGIFGVDAGGGYVGTDNAYALRLFTNNTERARITSGGYFKASDNGAYFGSTGTYHELNQSALADSTIARASNASYASSVLIARALRSQNSAYNLIYCDSGDGADAEFKFTGDGNGYADGTFNNNGADYAEYFESATGDALTVGATVVLDGNKVREATTDDPVSAIMGVVRPKGPSKASMVIGNTAWNKWANKYLTDDFDRYIMEDHEVVEWTDADGKQHSYESHNMPVGVTAPADAVRKTHDDKGNKFQHYKLNPAWNSDAEYTPREKRPEWNIIGLVGQVKVLKGKPVNDRWIKMRDVSASVEEWMIR